MQPPTPCYNTTENVTSLVDKAVSGDATFTLSEVQDTPRPRKPKLKKKVKAKMTAKEKKERGVRSACAFCFVKSSLGNLWASGYIRESLFFATSRVSRR